jgi:DNA-binding transcriptional ArsR family regulator
MARKSTKSASGEPQLEQLRQASLRLKQLSDPNRLLIVLMLADGARSVRSLSEALEGSQPALSQRLALLRQGGVVISERRGQQIFYSLTEVGEELARVAKDLTV